MGLKGRLVSEFEVRSSADRFYEMYRNPVDISSVSAIVGACELHEGEFGETGSIICWRYTQEGKELSSKQKVTVDDVNKRIVFEVIGGELMEEFKSFVITLEVTPEEDGMDLVKWIIDYEKITDDVQIPTAPLAVLNACGQFVESHHLKSG